jgi:mRNA degradation ribonuclease J1/J2
LAVASTESKLKGEQAKKPRPYEIVEGPFDAAGIAAEALPVSHSVEGATAYTPDPSAGAVVYTGDFRLHGYKGNQTYRLLSVLQNLIQLHSFVKARELAQPCTTARKR